MSNILIGVTIGLGISLILVWEMYYFSIRHWDENGRLTPKTEKKSGGKE